MRKEYNLNNLNILVKVYLMINFLMKDIRKTFIKKYSKLYDEAYVHLMFIKNVIGISQTELGYLTDTNKSTLSRNINTLIENELVIKKVSPRGNENELLLTTTGSVIVTEIETWIENHAQKVNLDQYNQEKLNSAILQVLSKYLI